MSSLNSKEQEFIRGLLKLMAEDSIRALAATITRRMVKTDSISACVDAIVLHTSSMDEFLKRQKVTKEHLFKYLNERKISVPNTDKAALEMQIKEYINGSGNCQDVASVPSPSISLIQSGSQSSVKPDLLSNTPAWTVQEPNRSVVTALQAPTQQQWSSSHPEGAAQLYLAAAHASTSRVTIEQRITTITASSANEAAIVVNLPDTQETAVTNEFAKWFYPRLNQAPGVLAEDFWPDADLKLTLKGSNNVAHRAAQGGPNVAQTLNGTLEEHQLFLHPNLSTDGVWGRGNEHGLLLVLVCGTLHHRTANHCLGVFENLFLLAQDPYAADNWKIRTLEAILRSKTPVTAPLTLGESELAKSLQ